MSKKRTSGNCNEGLYLESGKGRQKKLDIIEQTLEGKNRKMNVQIVRRLVETTLELNTKTQRYVRVRSW